jgi:hypothetical protein
VQEAEKRKLEMIKKSKIDELQAQGIPNKYQADLEKKKIGVEKLT